MIRKQWFYPAVFLLCLFCFDGAAGDENRPEPPAELPKRVLNIAHRGLSGIVPENTLLAVKMAITYQADLIEIDVYRSADGVVVLMHDRNLKRTTGLDADVTKKTFAELQELDAGAWKGKHFSGERIPSLKETLEMIRESNSNPLIEIKQDGIEKEIVEILAETGMTDRAYVNSFSTRALLKVRELQPRIKLWQIVDVRKENEKLEGDAETRAEALADILAAKADRLDSKVITFNKVILSQKLVDLLRARGYTTGTGVTNDVPGMERQLDMGFDIIVTDRPDLLSHVLKQRAKNCGK